MEGFAVELENDGFVSISELWLDHLGVGFLSTALRECPAELSDFSTWGALPIQVCFVLGSTDLPLSALRSLERRDVILLDECTLSPEFDRISVEFGENLIAAGQVSGRKITISSKLENCMGEYDSADIDKIGNIEELTVKISFDLGSRSVTLADLFQIGPGFVFDLGREVRRAVFIRANGKIVGEGELVDVDGKIGVSVLQILPSIEVSND